MQTKWNRKEHRNQFQKASFLMSNKLLSPPIVISDKINVIVSWALFIAFHLINQSGSTHTPSAGSSLWWVPTTLKARPRWTDE